MAFWDTSNAEKPTGIKDPNAVLDYPVSFAAWLADVADTYASHSVIIASGSIVCDSKLRTRWQTHVFDNPSLRPSRADVVKCIVLAGRRPIEEHELRCFEVFRNACKDVEVITFDELLAKLEYLQQHLQPIPDEVPF